MSNYICEICQKEIENLEDGNFVKIKNSDGDLLKIIPVHKGTCDDILCVRGRMSGLNTNGSMPLSFFENETERNQYLNGTFSMTDAQLYDKFFNEDGTLKKN